MIEKLKELDADFVLFVNGKHTPFLDSFLYREYDMGMDSALYSATLSCAEKFQITIMAYSALHCNLDHYKRSICVRISEELGNAVSSNSQYRSWSATSYYQ